MADTGHIAIHGFKAGAIKYVVLHGFVPNPSTSTLVRCVTSKGYGQAGTSRSRLALRGFSSNYVPPVVGNSVYYIFGGRIVS